MALHFSRPTMTPDGMTLHLDMAHGLATPEETHIPANCMPAEWAPQSGVQLTWPHAGTDWAPILNEVTQCYLRMAFEIASREPLLIAAQNVEEVKSLIENQLPLAATENIRYVCCPTNDTWARDHGPLTVLRGGVPVLLDFCFNGWGGKFEAKLDNQISRRCHDAGMFITEMEDHLDFVLEGGSIESDGMGTLMTTSECLLNPNRNPSMDKQEIEALLLRTLHAERILWIDHGYLAGDDTDSHVDTLARLCPDGKIAYVQCLDKEDEHYEELKKMEEQLQTFGMELIPLPMPRPIHDEDGERLPATYANFLILDTAILMPSYGQPDLDAQAARQLQKAFPRHEIVSIDCRVLIKQHGSLHCCTMQFPRGVMVSPSSRM